MTENPALKEKIAAARRAQNLTCGELEHAANLSKGTLLAVENGTRAVSVDEIFKLAEILNMRAGDLLQVGEGEECDCITCQEAESSWDESETDEEHELPLPRETDNETGSGWFYGPEEGRQEKQEKPAGRANLFNARYQASGSGLLITYMLEGPQ